LKRIGYHYTPLECWKRIRTEGLKPYKITRPDLYLFPNGTTWGIWVWQKRMHGKAHAGSILYQMSKGFDTVVHLQVQYDPDHRLTPPGAEAGGGGIIQLTHTGALNKLQYHTGDQAWIITQPIPRSDIKLLKTYEFKRAWR